VKTYGYVAVLFLFIRMTVNAGELLFDVCFNDTNGVSSLANYGSVVDTAVSWNGASVTNVYAPVNGGGYAGLFNGGVAYYGLTNSATIAAKDQLTSLTVSAWINLDAYTTASGNIVTDNSGAGFGFQITSAGVLRLRADGSNADTTNTVATGQWVFVAATYDGTLTVSNAKLYMGTSPDDLAMVRQVTLNKGVLGSNTDMLKIGGTGSANSGVLGLIDNVRLYGSQTDATGVLDLDALKMQMGASDTAVPERGVGLFILSKQPDSRGRYLCDTLLHF
jgi:hypothetical protein